MFSPKTILEQGHTYLFYPQNKRGTREIDPFLQNVHFKKKKIEDISSEYYVVISKRFSIHKD